MKEKILVPFAPILVESTRSIGYSFEAALADIIDNSIGSGAKTIKIDFQSLGKPYISITDDGCGMTEEELDQAMRYGSKSSLDARSETDLGRFGLGLKTASTSQCRKLTVISKINEDYCGACWDLDVIKKKSNWVLIKYSDKEIASLIESGCLNEFKSGTTVIWENFDRISDSSHNLQKILDEKIEHARDHVALVFHRYIDADNPKKNISIYFNNEKVIAYDPFLSTSTATQPLSEEVFKINGSDVRVKPFILPFASKLTANDKKKLGKLDDLRQNQGFYVYRSKRLIVWGTWFRLIKSHELNKLARIRVDIPNTLDSIWEIDVKKSTANIPDLIKKNLLAIVENSIGRSERVYKYRGRKINDEAIQHIWNLVDNRGKFQYLINRDLDLFKILEKSLDEKDIEYFNAFINMIEQSFPYQDVYYRIAKNSDGIIQTTVEEDEIYENTVKMIESMRIQGMDYIHTINTLHSIDYFKSYPNVIKKIKEEYIDE